MANRTPSRLRRRVWWSHVSVGAGAAIVFGLLLWALFYLSEDRTYARLVQLAADGQVPTGELGPLRIWRESELPADIAEFVAGRPDGVYEQDAGGVERHLSLRTRDGVRTVTALQLPETEQDTWLFLGLGTLVLGFACGGLWVGYRISQSVLEPAVRMSEWLAADRPDELLTREFADDEIGDLGRKLQSFLAVREQALQREREFLQDASHELRNPLAVLSAGVEVLKETGHGERAVFAERLDRLERSLLRMQHTVESLLQMARQEADLAATWTGTLSKGVAELTEELGRDLPSELKLEVVSSPAGPPSGPPIVWIVVLRNLLENAIRHTPRGTIRVDLAPDRVGVTDSGEGIGPERLAHITDAWVRGPRTRGFGLGLGIVKRLADRIGWTLEIESELGAGTRVVLRPASS